MKPHEQPRSSSRKPGSKERSDGQSAISISLTDELEEAFRSCAREEGRNLSEWARFHLKKVDGPYLSS